MKAVRHWLYVWGSSALFWMGWGVGLVMGGLVDAVGLVAVWLWIGGLDDIAWHELGNDLGSVIAGGCIMVVAGPVATAISNRSIGNR